MRRLAFWAAGLVVVALVLLIGLVELVAVTNEFTLLSSTSEPIVQGSVDVAGRSFKFENVEPGAKVTGAYRPSDSSILVRVKLRSGKELEGGVGYITNGVALRHDFVVSDEDIKTVETALKSSYLLVTPPSPYDGDTSPDDWGGKAFKREPF